VGLYGAGAELGGEWTVEPIDAGEGFAAAVAVERPGMRVVVHESRNEANFSKFGGRLRNSETGLPPNFGVS
jgi:hypothetical protein